MKIAVLGQDYSALEATLYFLQLEASVTWYFDEENQQAAFPFSNGLRWNQLTSKRGRDLLAFNQNLDLFPTECDFRTFYLEPLLEIFEARGVLKRQKVLRVQKRFLLAAETPSNTSRFADLFRVVSKFEPKINKEDQEEFYKKFDSTFLVSLTKAIESYDDFDVVIEATPVLANSYLQGLAPAINEKHFAEQIYYIGPEKIYSSNKTDQEIAIVGSGWWSAYQLFQLKDWLKQNKQHRLFVISTDPIPFKTCRDHSHFRLAQEVNQLINDCEADYREAIRDYEVKWEQWNENEDYIKAKIPAPELPIPQIVYFSGHMVTAIDRLIDQKKYFLTCERAPWREIVIHPENGVLDLKTISVDQVIVAIKGYKEVSLFDSLQVAFSPDRKDAHHSEGLHPEIGFFSLPTNHWFMVKMKLIETRLERIEARLMTLFSRKI